MASFSANYAKAGWLDDLKKAKKTLKEVEKLVDKKPKDKKKSTKKLSETTKPITTPVNKTIVFEGEKSAPSKSQPLKKKTVSHSNKNKKSKTVPANSKAGKNSVELFGPISYQGRVLSLGQARLRGKDGRPVMDNNKEIFGPQKIYALTYLKYYPEILEEDSMVQAYAQLFYSADARQFLNSGPNVFERRRKIAEWRQKLETMPNNPPKVFQYYLPVMFDGRYDFKKQSFPITINFPYNISLSSGVAGLACLELNQEFKLSELKVSENDAESFLKRNRSQIRTSSIFVGLRFTITGKTKKQSGQAPRCKLAAHVDAVEGFEYRGKKNKQYDNSFSKVGKRIKSWLTSNSADAKIELDSGHKVIAANEPQEAKTFKLATKKGLILALNATAISTYGISAPSQAAFREYSDFLALGINNKVLEVNPACFAKSYLEQARMNQYMDKRGRNWLGSTSFERDRNKASFIKTEGGKMLKKAVRTPQRYLVVNKVNLSVYNEKFGGYLLSGLAQNSTAIPFAPPCYRQGIKILPPADQVPDFWEIDPTSAEKMLNSLEAKTKRWNFGFVESIVSLSTIESASVEANQRYNVNPPIQARIESVTLYADKALTKVLHRFKIIKANPSVLETGLPKRLKISGEYPITAKDYSLLTLKHKGDIFDQFGWQDLTVFQTYSDKNYYANLVTLGMHQYKPNNQSFANSLSLDYRPFYPRVTEIIFDKMSKKQKKLFKKWASLRAQTFPNRVSYQTQIRWHQPTAQSNLELGTYGKRITLPKALADLGLKKNQIFYPVGGDRYGNAPVVNTTEGKYTVIYAFPKSLDQYANLSKAEVDKLVKKMGHPSSVGNAKLEFDITGVKFLKGKELGQDRGYMLIQAKPTKLRVYDHAFSEVWFEWSF
jgi:hypothetical protein